MRHSPFVLPVIVLTLLGTLASGALAQEGGPPPPDATPGAVGVSGPVLGQLDPVAAPGYTLRMVETIFAPGATVTRHTHPTAIVVCVKDGALGFAIHEGDATVTRGGTGDEPEATEPLAIDTEVVLEPRDCVAFDHFATHTVHSAWNASDETTTLWEAHLYKSDEPFTTFVDAMGTPVPS
jgi:predicted metal-dependent enzyme (double-stranded beta helix superfamily)